MYIYGGVNPEHMCVCVYSLPRMNAFMFKHYRKYFTVT